jgi:hypothetical protein
MYAVTELLEDVLRPHLTAPTPTVEVRGCADCPVRDGVQWIVLRHSGRPAVHCRIGGTLLLADGQHTPDGCPLRGGPVTLRLADRGRP